MTRTTSRALLTSAAVLSLVGCGNALSSADAAPAEPDAISLRAEGAEGLAKALRRYDALAPGPEKDAQAKLVDAVAGQRYATASRLFWHTDLESAKEDARAHGRPILSLRLLGRLDEDYSCANSRMFRTILYANTEVANYLRDTFTLHWSSERAVPKIEVDFGDGRVLRSTIAGNSAHYVLTPNGEPVDVIPGLYSPKAFVRALRDGAALANEDGLTPKAIAQAHMQAQDAEKRAYAQLAPAQTRALAPYRTKLGTSELLLAEGLTVSKMAIELPAARELSAPPVGAPDPAAVEAALGEVETLDASSRALIRAIGPTDWGAMPSELDGEAFERLVARVARRAAADTLINEHGLRPQIRAFFAQGPTLSFEELNARIYSEVFATPADDAWLGMAQPDVFTGLPADGLEVR